MSGPFFVGGIGRSGTSQLTRVLGEHPQVHAMKQESRFLVDPGGFEDLARALTVTYIPYHADDALGRPAWLLNVRLTGHSCEAFRGWGWLRNWAWSGTGRRSAGCGSKLAWFEYDEAVPATTSTSNSPSSPRRGEGRGMNAALLQNAAAHRAAAFARLPLGNAGARTLIRRISNWGNR